MADTILPITLSEWRRINPLYRDLSSDSALKTMNLKKDRKVLVKRWPRGDVLLKAVEAIDNHTGF